MFFTHYNGDYLMLVNVLWTQCFLFLGDIDPFQKSRMISYGSMRGFEKIWPFGRRIKKNFWLE